MLLVIKCNCPNPSSQLYNFMFSCMISCVQSMEALWWEAYISQAYVPHQHLETALQINRALSTNCNTRAQYQKVVFQAKREVFHFTKTNKDANSSLYTQIWFHYTSNNSLSAGAPVSQLYLVKLLCYAQKPLQDMHGDSDRINRRMSSSLHCFPCLVNICP